MKIVFRTDSSIKIGTGHVMRCLTLANALRDNGYECCFVCRELTGNLTDFIMKRGFQVKKLKNSEKFASIPDFNQIHHEHWLETDWKTDALQTVDAIGNTHYDWLVVDHYALDSRWEKALRGCCQKILAIDDLADRRHDCDLILDQNLGRKYDNYLKLVPDQASQLIGPKFSLLRPQFQKYRSKALKNRSVTKLNHLLILMGGSDIDNFTGKTLETLARCQLPSALKISVVMGIHAPYLKTIKNLASKMPVETKVLVDVVDMASLMAQADIAIGAAGGTSWERCVLGLPSLIFVLANNQKEIAEALALAGAAKVLKNISQLESDEYFGKFENMLQLLAPMSKSAATITDGLGVYRLVQKMEETYD